jgi:TolA-binding protein
LSGHDNDNVLPDAARYVQPKVTEARLARVWAGVDARLPGRRAARRVWGWVGAGALALGAATAVVFAVGPSLDGSPDPESLLAGAVLETASDSLSMGLLDGSSLTLAETSRVEVLSSSPGGVRLRLKRGRIACDVKHRADANFVVVADGVEVRVVGTKFSVTAERDDLSRRVVVEVERGEVEIRSSSEPDVVRLKAGRSWSQVTKTGPAKAAAPVPASAAEPAPEPPKTKTPSEPQDAAPGPRELLEEANELRRAGNAREAAKRYETLLNQYGSDGRAGLAAFELGRLRMDRFGDMKGAISALEKAMALAPGSSFREDALARVVTAHARSGNLAECKRAKERYLRSYPRGGHREAVLEQCGGP